MGLSFEVKMWVLLSISLAENVITVWNLMGILNDDYFCEQSRIDVVPVYAEGTVINRTKYCW